MRGQDCCHYQSRLQLLTSASQNKQLQSTRTRHSESQCFGPVEASYVQAGVLEPACATTRPKDSIAGQGGCTQKYVAGLKLEQFEVLNFANNVYYMLPGTA